MVQKTVIEWLEENHPSYYSSAKIAELNDAYFSLDYAPDDVKDLIYRIRVIPLEFAALKEALGIQDKEY
jgi:hypothetical protein